VPVTRLRVTGERDDSVSITDVVLDPHVDAEHEITRIGSASGGESYAIEVEDLRGKRPCRSLSELRFV